MARFTAQKTRNLNMNEHAERTKFEAWILTNTKINPMNLSRRPNRPYYNQSVQSRWTGWKARAELDISAVLVNDGSDKEE